MNTDTPIGHLHPLSRMTQEASRIFTDMGFEFSYGSHVVSEWENFDSLNIPKDHPARDMHDTLWLKDVPKHVMRTHISSHQVPYLSEHKDELRNGPLKMFSIGRVYRNEATDATHETHFTYMEGLMVGEKITLGHLKGTLEHFIQELFSGIDVDMRLRPGYFPFVEPGLEVDLRFQENWLEVLGAGMVHPTVLQNSEIDSGSYSGFAFGVGIDRLAMIRHGVDDIRLFYSGDLRFLTQF